MRQGSGGKGKFTGGEGVIREIEFLTNIEVGILSERRVLAPWGYAGGEDGERGQNLIVYKDGHV